MYFYCLNKRYAKVICKWITYIIKNLEIEYDISNSEAKSRILQFIVLEKSNNRKRGLRYAAKGRTYRTDVVSTRLNAYIN
jgi:hypothetical protein